MASVVAISSSIKVGYMAFNLGHIIEAKWRIYASVN